MQHIDDILITLGSGFSNAMPHRVIAIDLATHINPAGFRFTGMTLSAHGPEVIAAEIQPERPNVLFITLARESPPGHPDALAQVDYTLPTASGQGTAGNPSAYHNRALNQLSIR